MPHPLELSYNWRPPVSIATLALTISVGVLVHGRVNGWRGVVVVLVVVWALFMVVVWVRTRAYIMVDGPMMRVRRFVEFHELDGRRVSRVTQFLTPNGPSYRVSVRGLNGDPETHVVPSALLIKGHSTLFEWILTWAPGAELDKGSLKTIEQLRVRGLIE